MARYPEIYADPQWELVRQIVIVRDQGLCVLCRVKGRIKAGVQVDHIIELNDENKNDWNIAFNPDNLRLLCDGCHQHRHGRSNGLQDFLEPVSI